jgi:hypothetical protein
MDRDFEVEMAVAKNNQQEVKQRLKAILAGAFRAPPTPLKNIPKRNGESRGNKLKKRRPKYT